MYIFGAVFKSCSIATDSDKLDTLGIEPRASRMLSGCDTTTPCAHVLDIFQILHKAQNILRTELFMSVIKIKDEGIMTNESGPTRA